MLLGLGPGGLVEVCGEKGEDFCFAVLGGAAWNERGDLLQYTVIEVQIVKLKLQASLINKIQEEHNLILLPIFFIPKNILLMQLLKNCLDVIEGDGIQICFYFYPEP